MLSIAIYSNLIEDVAILKTLIQDYLIESKSMAKISCFPKGEDIILIPNRYDVYFIDMDTEEDSAELGESLRKIDRGSKFVYMSINPNKAQRATKARCDYFITKPFDKIELIEILTEIKEDIRQDSFIIKIPSGERRVRVDDLNYVNIVRRCLCYHLKDGNMFDGQTLRSSFEKAIHPLEEHKSFIFLAPSLLINLNEIQIINKDHLIFDNADILYFPMKQYDVLRNAWINYNKI